MINTRLPAAALISLWFLPIGYGQTSTEVAEVRIRGDVRRIQSLPDGSFVLGGYTAYFNGTRDEQLIRLTAAGARVPFPVTVNGPVQALALAGPWLYLGGDFQVVNGASCPFVARVDATNGTVDATWRPAPNGDLLDIIPVQGGVILSGAFSRVAGLPRSRLAVVSDQGSGLPVETWRCDADGQIDRLLLHQGWLYLAGRFAHVAGYPITFLARINPSTAVLDTTWNPNPFSYVYDLAGDDSFLYCAGDFGRIGNANVPYLARLPLNSTGADASWAPTPDSIVTRVCVSGDSVYASGNFTTISGLPQKYLARIPRVGGSADGNWKPPIDGALLALVPDGGNGCWGGGRFDSGVAGGSAFAHFSNTQGSSAPLYPATLENLGAVKVIKPDPNSGGWLAGGDFDTVNGLSRHALFRLQPNRVLDPAWSAGLGGFYTEVNAIDIIADANEGGDVMIGGQFEVAGIGHPLLYNCLLLKLISGETVPSFKPQPSDTVHSIVREPTGTWLLGGNFTGLGVYPANYVARIRSDGNIEPFFAPNPNGPVHAILQFNGDTYLGGEFTSFKTGQGSVPISYLARLNNIAPDLGWQPQPNQAVFALAAEGNSIYAGGRFTRMARSVRRNLAQLPVGGAGTPTAWNPNPDNEVDALCIDSGRLYVGGAFFTIANYKWPKLARFSLPPLSLDTDFQTSGENGAVYAIEPEGSGDLLIGGSFNGWDNDFTKRSLINLHPGGVGPSAALPIPAVRDGTPELLADYFAPSVDGARGLVNPLPAENGPGLVWEENPTLPRGVVAWVQWSSDLLSWHQSGETIKGLTCSIEIQADGTKRIARVRTDGPVDHGLFLRLEVAPGSDSPSKLLH